MLIDFNNITTTRSRGYDANKIAQINEALQDIPIKQRAAILGSIIEESGGDPMAKSKNGTYQGLLQWGEDRYRIDPKASEEEEFNRQIAYIRSTLNNTKDKKSWTHGGEGSGYQSYQNAYNAFNSNTLPIDSVFRGFNYGYVRPEGKEDSYDNRLKVAKQVYDRILEDEKINSRNTTLPYNPREVQPIGPIKQVTVPKISYRPEQLIRNNFWTQWGRMPYKAEGGPLSDKEYYRIMEKVAEDNYKKWGFNTSDEALTHALNDNTYNYRGFYNKYPHSEANADTHWTDEFKTVWHPTFSDESIYSGKKSQFNPQGIQGGHWFGDTFIPSVPQMNEQNKYEEGGSLTLPKLWNDLTMAEKAEMMKVAIQNGITTLPEIRDRYNEFAKGGYAPSENIKRKIEQYEGKAMTGAIDPLSGKWAKNNSFESEARGFYNALPEDIRDEVLSNPQLADSLYSYSYNVGAGNFKKRVVPALRKYYQGEGSVADIEKSMWASGDSKLRGLQRRRADERAGVRRALSGESYFPIYAEDNSESTPAFIPSNPKAFFSPLATYDIPTAIVPSVEEPLVQAADDYAYSKKALDRQERMEKLNNFNILMSMMNPVQSDNSLIGAINLLKGNSGI